MGKAMKDVLHLGSHGHIENKAYACFIPEFSSARASGNRVVIRVGLRSSFKSIVAELVSVPSAAYRQMAVCLSARPSSPYHS